MNLSFDQIEIVNFGSFVKQTVDLRSYPIGLNFLRGRNEYEPRLGANDCGKSTIWRAFTWCLFGRTVDNLRNPDVRPWNRKGETVVSVQIGKHAITRSIAPNQTIMDGQPTGQEQIDKLLGMNFEVFTHTILLGQGQPLFFDLRPAEKMRVFAEVLNLEKWVSRSKAASNQADDIQRDIDVKTGELNGLAGTMDEVKALIDGARSKSEEWEADRSDRLKNGEKQLTTWKKEQIDHQKHLDQADLDHDGASTEAKALDNEIYNLKEKANADLNKHNKLDLEVKSINREIDRFHREIDALGDADQCPTCGQSIKDTNLDKHKKELHKEISTRKTKIKELCDAMRDIDLNKYMAQLETLSASHDQFKEKIADAENRKSYRTQRVNDLKVKIDTLTNSIKELSNNNNPYEEQLRTLRKRREKLKVNEKELQDDLVILNRKLERTKFWIKGFKDVQLYVVNEVLQELELVSNSMLSDIGLDDWNIHYSIEKETQSGSIQRGLNVVITSPANDKPVKWECWGGGVSQRLRIVGSLALSDVLLNHAGVSSNLEVLDEPSQHLSREGVRDLCPFLAERARQTNKIIVLVDHMAIPSSEFASVTTVVKSPKRVSMIEHE